MIKDIIAKLTIVVVGCAVAIPMLLGIFIWNIIDYYRNFDYYERKRDGNNS